MADKGVNAIHTRRDNFKSIFGVRNIQIKVEPCIFTFRSHKQKLLALRTLKIKRKGIIFFMIKTSITGLLCSQFM